MSKYLYKIKNILIYIVVFPKKAFLRRGELQKSSIFAKRRETFGFSPFVSSADSSPRKPPKKTQTRCKNAKSAFFMRTHFFKKALPLFLL